MDVPHPIDGSYYCRDCGASQSAGYRQAELDRQRRADIASAGDRERMARWHATFNAALTGSMACGTKYMDACADARGAANHMHGPLPEEKP